MHSFIHFTADLKKNAQCELQIEFYLGQYEDCSLGDSTSDSSERLFQSHRGKGQYICDFGEGGMLLLLLLSHFSRVRLCATP